MNERIRKLLEQALDALIESDALNHNFVSVSEVETLLHLSEYKIVLQISKSAIAAIEAELV
jgi:hypothetical protein